MSALPKEINYTQRPMPLPEGTQTISVVSQPANGNSFLSGGQIQFDLLSRGYLIPSSMYLRYNLSFTATATAPQIKATPAYTCFSRLECFAGGSTLESITNYGQVANMLLNCRTNYAQKFGLSQAFGIYGASATGNITDVTEANGWLGTASVSNTLQLAMPLGCVFSNCEQLFPLKYVPGCRIQLTIDSIANIFSVGAPTAISITNVELCYDIADFSTAVDMAVESMVDERGRLMIKSQSYVNAGQSVPAASVGSFELIYNYRLQSIKSLFALCAGTHANAVNGLYDALDITSSNGRYQFQCSGLQFPNLPLDTLRNKSAVLMELSNAFGPIGDLLTSQFSISPPEFNYINTATTTTYVPGKFYIGVNCERLQTSALLTGISTMNSPISLRIDINTSTTNAQVVYVIANYDCILEVDVANKQLSLIC